MDPDFVNVVIGLTAAIGGFIVRDRQIMSSINNGDNETRKIVVENSREAHQRISQIQNELNQRMVQLQSEAVTQQDLNRAIENMNNVCAEIKNDHRELIKRIDSIIEIISRSAHGRE